MRRRSATGRQHHNGFDSTRLNKEEVSALFDQLDSEERTERAWRQMHEHESDDADHFAAVEEHLIHQPHERDPQLRRWKYFGK